MSLTYKVEELFRKRSDLTPKHHSWEEVKLFDVCEIRNGFAFKSIKFNSEGIGKPLIRIRDVTNNFTNTYYDGDFSKDYIIREGDLIIGMDGDFNSNLWNGPDALLNQRVCRLIPMEKFLNIKFLAYGLDGYLKVINENTSSITVKHLSSRDIGKIPFSLPPINEQNRIVEKLDVIFSKIDSIKERMDIIPKLIKQFRQSVLHAAVTGKLTEEWRKANEIRWFQEIEQGKENKIGWKTQIAEDACLKVQNGTTPKNNPFTIEGDIPFLKVYNIQDQKIAFDYKPQFVKRAVHDSVLKRSIAFPNDVIINIVGPPLGKVALVTSDYSEWNLNQAIVLFRPKDYLLSKYLYYFLCEGSEIFKYSSEYKGSAGQTNISLTQCRKFSIPIPSIDEQKEIINQVNRFFSLADSVEEKYLTLKEEIELLPQSLLRKAFKGELVPQDKNDEPAEKLIGRILQEKEKRQVKRK